MVRAYKEEVVRMKNSYDHLRSSVKRLKNENCELQESLRTEQSAQAERYAQLEERLEEERARTMAARSHASEAYRLENGSYINTIEEEEGATSERYREVGTDSVLASARAAAQASERSEEFRRRVEALEEEKRGFEELLSQREQEKSQLEVKNREVEERNA